MTVRERWEAGERFDNSQDLAIVQDHHNDGHALIIVPEHGLEIEISYKELRRIMVESELLSAVESGNAMLISEL